MRTLFGFLGALLLMTASAVADEVPSFTMDNCDVPDGTVLGANTVPEYAHLVGVYTGKWSNALPSTLIVVDVDRSGSIDAYYSFDRYRNWNIQSAGCSRWNGIFEDGTLTFRGRNATVTYEVEDDGAFIGTFDRAPHRNRGTFTKIADHPWQGTQ